MNRLLKKINHETDEIQNAFRKHIMHVVYHWSYAAHNNTLNYCFYYFAAACIL